MINFSGTVRIVKDATLIVQEGVEIGMKRDGCGAIGESLLEAIRSSVGCYGARNSYDYLVGIIGTVLVLGYIGVRRIGHESELLHICVTISEQATFASIVSIGP